MDLIAWKIHKMLNRIHKRAANPIQMGKRAGRRKSRQAGNFFILPSSKKERRAPGPKKGGRIT